MIDYGYKPKAFSNSVIIDYSYFAMLYDLLGDNIIIQPETIIGLSIFTEAIVLNEELIPTNNIQLTTTGDYERDFLKDFIDKKILYYDNEFMPILDSGTDCLYNELSEYYENLIDYSYGKTNIYNEKKLYRYVNKMDELANNHGIPSIRGIYNALLGNVTYNFKDLEKSTCIAPSTEILNYIDENFVKKLNSLLPYKK